MRIKVCVTEIDILRGERNHGQRCPIALAVKRALPPKSGFLRVGSNAVFLWVDSERLWRGFRLPRSARRAIRKFDDYGTMTSFNFYLEIPDED